MLGQGKNSNAALDYIPLVQEVLPSVPEVESIINSYMTTSPSGAEVGITPITLADPSNIGIMPSIVGSFMTGVKTTTTNKPTIISSGSGFNTPKTQAAENILELAVSELGGKLPKSITEISPNDWKKMKTLVMEDDFEDGQIVTFTDTDDTDPMSEEEEEEEEEQTVVVVDKQEEEEEEETVKQ